MQESSGRITRRRFQSQVLGTGLGCLGAWLRPGGLRAAPAVLATEQSRPQLEWGVSAGDVTSSSAVLWSRADRSAQMHVELARDESFQKIFRRIRAGESLENRDFTGKIRVSQLPAGETIHYRIRFESLEHPGVLSAPLTGRFSTAPAARRAIRFLWSGDTAGQGFGIDPARGGMSMYRTMLQQQPDFFIHCGDTIYADNPLSESLTLDDGSQWRNLVTPEKSKVAETLDEFRGAFRYNHLDEHFRAFHSQVPILVQWDDHETLNNWYPGEVLDDDRYTVKSVSLLAARARTAFFEYHPLAEQQAHRIYRSIPYGPDLELFVIDMRSERGPNTANRQPTAGPQTAFLGKQQVDWLVRRLTESTATWKIICSDMPIGLLVRDGAEAFENLANGDGPPLGRELEMASLLSRLKRNNVRNIIWLTADVHYAASHYYDPNRAEFQDFLPFWEFVSGPIHAGTFGPGALDNTFGPQVVFKGIPDGMKPGRPPSDGLQFFGQVDLDGQSGELTVAHYNVAGERLWEKTFSPE